MQRFVGVLVVAVVAGLIGLGFLAASAATRVATTTFGLQPGANYCTYRAFDLLAGGSITITYSATPGTVYQYVMTDAQHSAWLAGSGVSYIGVDQGSANTFTTSLPSGGTYYVLSCHGSGYDTTVQSGRHTLAISGLDPGPFYVGLGGLVFAVLLVATALWLRRRDAQAAAFRARMTPYVPGYGLVGPSPSMIQIPPTGPTPSRAAYGTIHVSLENRSSAEETVQLLLNGAPAVTVTVPAGGTSQATLHPPIAFPAGTAVRIEAATPDGRRGGQDVLVRADVAATVALQIG